MTIVLLLLVNLSLMNQLLNLKSMCLGATKDLLEAAQFPCNKKNAKCDPHLTKNLLKVIERSVTPDTTLRPITLELCCIVIRGLVLALEEDDVFIKEVADLAIEMQKRLAQKLSEVVFSEDLFLEMFEEEHYAIDQTVIRMEHLASNAGLYLPPSSTPLSKMSLSQRLPCGNEERIRRVSFGLLVIKMICV
jgi:hypothetical protein